MHFPKSAVISQGSQTPNAQRLSDVLRKTPSNGTYRTTLITPSHLFLSPVQLQLLRSDDAVFGRHHEAGVWVMSAPRLAAGSREFGAMGPSAGWSCKRPSFELRFPMQELSNFKNREKRPEASLYNGSERYLGPVGLDPPLTPCSPLILVPRQASSRPPPDTEHNIDAKGRLSISERLQPTTYDDSGEDPFTPFIIQPNGSFWLLGLRPALGTDGARTDKYAYRYGFENLACYVMANLLSQAAGSFARREDTEDGED
ncbi:hypothetical protein DFP72DRAFT_844043 [Ephemerocybe angulata]|uniref:Uncharacterized protein n=1 Tax=Ephemerocybe angulata TaxID=980116 RepID=A0A8H6M9G3_9AGAR|nr:hypothetical protein DFP72DRAFT_844043 [Tulosesus angulatus]